jgi:hypothetical protein
LEITTAAISRETTLGRNRYWYYTCELTWRLNIFCSVLVYTEDLLEAFEVLGARLFTVQKKIKVVHGAIFFKFLKYHLGTQSKVVHGAKKISHGCF